MAKHIHADSMMEYAQDALETKTPWERWESAGVNGSNWKQLTKHPHWYNQSKYRRKPRTININGYEVPEPYRSELEVGKRYYIPDICCGDLFDSMEWDDDDFEYKYSNLGLIHLTEEAAILHAKALLSFTKDVK